MADVEKYSDGTEIKRFPRWVYPGNEPKHAGPANRNEHNGVLVNNQKELEAALASFGEGEAPVKEVKNKSNWAK